MSASPDDPDHFCRWLDEHAVTAPEGFAPRLAYGRYLQEQLVGADVRVETAEVVGVVPGASTQVKLAEGRSLTAASIGGSRLQQEVILETALAAMLQRPAPAQAARLLSRHRTTPGPQVTRGAVN